jgi:hypothetical protein
MGADMKANGSTTTWKAWEFTFGTMVGSIKVSTKMIRSMGLEFILGPIKDAMKAIGTKENNMVLENMWYQKKTRQSSAYGKMENVLSGSTKTR